MDYKSGIENIYKRMKYIIPVLLLFLTNVNLSAAQKSFKEIYSPDKKIKLSYLNSDENKFSVKVYYKDSIEMLSVADPGIKTDKNGAGELKLIKVSDPESVKEEYRMLTGKKSLCENEGVECKFYFEDENKDKLNLIFRVYNDGVVFRYEFPELKETILNAEKTRYKISTDANKIGRAHV